MRYCFIHAERTNFPLRLLCKTLHVSRQGYYSWLTREGHERPDYSELDMAIREIHEENDAYGVRRVRKALPERGFEVGVKTVRKRMRALGVRAQCSRPFKVTTEADPKATFEPNLLARNFKQQKANRVWVGDVTYLRTPTGFQYLAVVIDLYSRMVVGWSVQAHMRTELVDDALRMALGLRNVDPGLIFHSDRGSQYTSEKFRETCKNAGIVQSMSRKGDCWDNAVAESFFATLKKELLNRNRRWSRDRLKLELFSYIETYYNRKRLHSTLGYKSPMKFEREERQLAKNAQAA